MPITLEKDIRPTIVIQPDMRFATTFLSTKYRDYAVPGEAIMDKASGELFFKRPTDGKVISFFQNKKFIHDLALEARILLVNNPSFTYPETDEEAFFVSENYDVVTMNNEGLFDLTEEDIVIQNEPDSINEFTFHVAGGSNGFFIRVATRDVDKPVVEYLTNQYNLCCENYAGGVEAFILEREKFSTEPRWKDSNCTIYYTLRVESGYNDTKIYRDCYSHVRANESTVITFPDEVNVDFPGGADHYIVQIQSITFDKLHFVIQNRETFGFFEDTILSNYEKLLYDDNMIQPAEVNVMRFVNNADQIEILGNESIIAFMDVAYINRYMRKMSQFMTNNAIYNSVLKPVDSVWLKNTIWAEQIRKINPYKKPVPTGAQFDISTLELIFGGADTNVKRVFLTMDNNEDTKSYLLINTDAAVTY